MRILVEPNAHHLQNVGDVAMLQVAVKRLRELWPGSQISVITDAPDLLARYCPSASAVSAEGRRSWFSDQLIGHRVHEALPPRLAVRAKRAEDHVRSRWPSAANGIIKAKRRLKGTDSAELDEFVSSLLSADLVVVSGAGAITDDFAPLALTILDLLDLAIRRGTPAAMFGQGIGPIDDAFLREKAASVLPRVSAIGIREQACGLPLLRSLGVPTERIFATGDDAIELAYSQRPPPRATPAIGVSLRMARYSGLDERVLKSVRATLLHAADQHRAQLIGLPISRHHKERDAVVITRVLPDGSSVEPPVDAKDVIERTRRCRLVVTGSYHAGVFALAQGIPIVGLAASNYYVSKFEGLIDQFGTGCELVQLDDPDFTSRLARAIGDAWSSADEVAPQLRAAARAQIEQSRAAYRSLLGIVAGPGASATDARDSRQMSPADWRAPITRVRRRLARIAGSRREDALGSNFNCADQESPSWEERATLAVDLLRNRLVSRGSPRQALLIGDFGAGNERLRRLLGEQLGVPHEYRGYDLKPQQSATTRIDLEHELPPQPFDVVFCLGLLEYVRDPAELLSRLSRACDAAVLSYALFDGPERLTAADRRARGWVTDLTRDDMETMLENAGFRHVAFRTANRERTGIWLVESQSARGQSHASRSSSSATSSS